MNLRTRISDLETELSHLQESHANEVQSLQANVKSQQNVNPVIV
jgi:hypothetical protein